jgi:hypothetical protein
MLARAQPDLDLPPIGGDPLDATRVASGDGRTPARLLDESPGQIDGGAGFRRRPYQDEGRWASRAPRPRRRGTSCTCSQPALEPRARASGPSSGGRPGRFWPPDGPTLRHRKPRAPQKRARDRNLDRTGIREPPRRLMARRGWSCGAGSSCEGRLYARNSNHATAPRGIEVPDTRAPGTGPRRRRAFNILRHPPL